MANKYQVNSTVRFANKIIMQLFRWGVPMPGYSILSVRGRKSGKTYSAPVEPVEADGKRWIVSPYGEVSWVKNARANGEISLTRSGKTETVRVRELNAVEKAPILKTYITNVPVTRPYFDVAFEAPAEDFIAEGARHPVFLVVE